MGLNAGHNTDSNTAFIIYKVHQCYAKPTFASTFIVNRGVCGSSSWEVLSPSFKSNAELGLLGLAALVCIKTVKAYLAYVNSSPDIYSICV